MINSIAKFYKVSKTEFINGVSSLYPHCLDICVGYDEIQLPKRSTTGSAGYDFYSPIGFVLKPGCSVVVPTCIRANIEPGWFLEIVPRSGLGFKYQVGLANTVGIIDSDYFYSENEGHIMVKLVNNGTKDVSINPGDRFAQGIFVQYGITTDDDATESRVGGFGSTGK